jgi:hypothetical protein
MSYLAYLDNPKRFVYKLFYDQQPRVPTFDAVADKAPNMDAAYSFWQAFVDNAPLRTRRFNRAPLAGAPAAQSGHLPAGAFRAGPP